MNLTQTIILCIIAFSPIIILGIVINEFLLGLFPCEVDRVIENLLERNGYVGFEKQKLKRLLLYEYKYHRCDRYSRLVKTLKELEKEFID